MPSNNLATIGEYTYGTPIIKHWGEDAKLKIGKFCSIAGEVRIYLGGNHRTDWITTYPLHRKLFNEKFEGQPSTNGDVNIGNDVWLGDRCVILSGVTVGNGAVVGCDAVVTKDVLAYSVVAGNPAQVKYKRFTPEQIETLEEIQWWNWDIEKIKKYADALRSENIDEVIKMHKEEF